MEVCIVKHLSDLFTKLKQPPGLCIGSFFFKPTRRQYKNSNRNSTPWGYGMQVFFEKMLWTDAFAKSENASSTKRMGIQYLPTTVPIQIYAVEESKNSTP
mmetsp:Transcript_7864/g.15744  ORF Transcript_7864/g.15744 Transcript_7864/m.15744 type:complete len:100 (+) Transcript_7864:212-511(+)